MGEGPVAPPEVVLAVDSAPPKTAADVPPELHPDPPLVTRVSKGRRAVGRLVILSIALCVGCVVSYQHSLIANQKHRIHVLERENRELMDEPKISILHVQSTFMVAILGKTDEDSNALAMAGQGADPEEEEPVKQNVHQDEAGATTNDANDANADGEEDGGKRGVTWVVTEEGGMGNQVLSRATCWGHGHRCDAYNGDTLCTEARPLLCLRKAQLPRPEYNVRPNPRGVMGDSFYEGWTGGKIGVTKPVKGSSILSRSNANQLCAAELGEGYEWADHRDGDGGWNWWAFGSVPKNTPFWTSVIGQPSACFD